MQRQLIPIAALIVSATLAVLAIKILYYSWTAPAPVVMQCDDYLRNGSDAVWLDLRDCTLDYAMVRRVFWTKPGLSADDDNYIPVMRHLGDANIALFLKPSADEAAYLNALPDNPTPAQRISIAVRIRAMTFHRRIKGLIQTDFDTDTVVNDVIGKAHLSLAPGWKIIEEKDPMPLWIAYLLLPLSLVSGLAGLWMLRRKRPADAAGV